MRIVVVPDDPTAGDDRLTGTLQALDDDGIAHGQPGRSENLAATIAEHERQHGPAQQHRPRWVWPDTAALYPRLLAAGVRVERCQDLTRTEALLLGFEERPDSPPHLAAAWARLNGDEPPALAAPPDADEPEQPSLFPRSGPPLPAGADRLHVVLSVHRDQQQRATRAAATSPGFPLLVAAESAGALCAAEMTRAGLPWRTDVHDQLLTEALGPRPPRPDRPAVLQRLAEQVADALDTPHLNPDSPGEVLRAFTRQGVALQTTRRSELRRLDHPAVEPLLRYKELARLHAANGWAWADRWVRDGRFRPEYVPGGVVSGRWSSRGGGALQIPRALRGAVVADAGHVLVVADARQLEPRVLAAMSGDQGMARAAADDGPGGGDLYAGLAAQAFGGNRDLAKVALLSAMYGGGSAGAGAAGMTTLRQRFPAALELVERAARAGEDGAVVRSVLGRTCPPPRPGWLSGPEEVARRRARDRGRFTRNFVVQASAADWAAALLAVLRSSLAADGPGPGEATAELVFFQHDEVLVHARRERAGEVVTAVHEAARRATAVVFGSTPVPFPMAVTVGSDYAEAKT